MRQHASRPRSGGWIGLALLLAVLVAMPSAALGAERVVLGEYFNALW